MTEGRGRAVQIQPTAKNARNHSQCDSMLIGDTAGANTYPYIQVGHRACPDIFFIFLFGRYHKFQQAPRPEIVCFALLINIYTCSLAYYVHQLNGASYRFVDVRGAGGHLSYVKLSRLLCSAYGL